MRDLRFVMAGGDDHLVVETSGTAGFERFRLPITDELREALGTAAAETTSTAPEPAAERRPMPTAA
jgi:hypothetical protein